MVLGLDGRGRGCRAATLEASALERSRIVKRELGVVSVILLLTVSVAVHGSQQQAQQPPLWGTARRAGGPERPAAATLPPAERDAAGDAALHAGSRHAERQLPRRRAWRIRARQHRLLHPGTAALARPNRAADSLRPRLAD